MSVAERFRRWLWIPAVAAGCIVIAVWSHAGQPAAGSQVDNPFRGVMQDRSADSPDEALYVEKCGMCHRRMGMGTVILARRMNPTLAMLEARAELTPEWIAAAVRQGIGNMPRIGRGELSDAQLAIVSAYLTRPRPEH